MPRARKDLDRKQRRGRRRPSVGARSESVTLPAEASFAHPADTFSPTPALRSQRFAPEQGYVLGELKVIGIIGGAMILLIIILSFVL